jgi:catechol 2,3-dioxygenase-like lactoylglutathione lyase family enzyme
MIEHVSLRCKDAKKSRQFYEEALRPLGYVCDMEYEDAFGFKDRDGRHDFWVTKGKPGEPTHFAFLAKNAKEIDAFYDAAIAAGGKDNGKPGPRKGYAARAAFVYDPDGNNVEVVIWDEPKKGKR